MADHEFHETYVTKKNPTVDDWLGYQDLLFTRLNEGQSTAGVPNAPLVDVQKYADEQQISVEEYYEKIKEKVGPLGGRAALLLVDSQMDDSYHIVVGPADAEQK